MTNGNEERIKMRAHQIWESEGRPDGREAQHWEQARREIEGEGQGDAGTTGTGGLASGLQPGGAIPGGGPGAGQGSMGTGGGSTGGKASGSLKRSRAAKR